MTNWCSRSAGRSPYPSDPRHIRPDQRSVKSWWRQIASAVEAGRLEIVTSPEAIAEFLDVSARPSKEPLIDPADAATVADLLRRVQLFSPTSIVVVCRDASDNFLLVLAETSSADLLVTRDEDLLVLRTHGRTRIVHVAEFLRLIAAEAHP